MVFLMPFLRFICILISFSVCCCASLVEKEPTPIPSSTLAVPEEKVALKEKVALSCPDGFEDCDGDRDNACETNVSISPLHCGTCAQACSGGLGCKDGVCQDHVVGLIAGPAVSCGWTAKGHVICSGRNNLGQVGVGTRSAPCGLVRVPRIDDAVQVSVGPQAACAVRATGRVVCWGRDLAKLAYDSDGPVLLFPTEVPEIDDAQMVSVGDRHACVLERSGRVVCWGDNSYEQLGSKPGSKPVAPTEIAELEGASAVFAGISKTCVKRPVVGPLCLGSGELGIPRIPMRFEQQADGSLLAWPEGHRQKGRTLGQPLLPPKYASRVEDACRLRDEDGDGLEDDSDRCPDRAEVFNAVMDDDGCPDQGASLVRVNEEASRVLLLTKVIFQADTSTLKPARQPVLDHLAAALNAFERIEQIEIQAHSDGSADRY